MKNRICFLIPAVFVFLLCTMPAANADFCGGTEDSTFTVVLPVLPGTGVVDSITIPNGRPIYALIVHGYSQNKDFDQLMVYDFAKYLMKQGAYVHYSWWNNLCAEYMARPLHNSSSQPGNLLLDVGGFVPLPWLDGSFGGKAVPAEDYQFQADAKLYLQAIRDNNPNAMIVVVGHSMGGASIARLATDSDVLIDLLAPIDPVENRGTPVGRGLTAEYNWTRWRIARDEFKGYKQYYCSEWAWWGPILYCATCSGYGENWYGFNTLPWPHSRDLACGILPFVDSPPRRNFGANIVNLFHRYQKEAVFPFDFLADEHFVHTPPTNGTSSQAAVSACWIGLNSAGWLCLNFDGHGEIVGFYGTSPEGLQGSPDWRFSASRRKQLLIEMANAPDNWAHRPKHPEFCMVSSDLIALFKSINRPPEANAGEDQIVVSTGPGGAEVTLSGSASYDSDNDVLSYLWQGTFGQLSGQVITPTLGVGAHDITLTVIDPSGHIDCDMITVTVTEQSCCIASTGNIDCDPNSVVDIADLTTFVSHLFIDLQPLCCEAEANIDGDQQGVIDIADLTRLIDHLFISLSPTSACQ